MKIIIHILLLFFSFIAVAQENCDNGIDDDGDGKIDLNDPDCACSTSSINSIIPNASFETFSSCPTSFSYEGNDQLSLATPWIQATTATSDYHNSCGYMFPSIEPAGLQNFPDGNGVVGTIFMNGWKEYIGTSLLSSMVSGTSYQLTFNIAAMVVEGQGELASQDISIYEPVNITIYGCTNGANLPKQTVDSPNISDPTWVEIGHITYTPVMAWGEVTLSFTPSFDINAIMIGAPQVLPISYQGSFPYFPYFLYDNLLLNTSSSFGVAVSQSGNFCDNNLVLNANLTTSFSASATYQWYHNGIAIIGATTATYSVPGFATSLGSYSVKVTDGGTCFVSSLSTVNNSIPAPTVTIIQPTCIITTGLITVTTPAAQYSFDNGATWQTSAISNPLPIGTYFVKIKTPSGCISASIGVSVLQPQLLAGSNFIVIQPTTCDGTGSITITANNATEYSFDNGVTWSTNATATGLAPGVYYIMIKDSSGCQSSSQTIYIDQIYLDYPDYTAVQPICGTGGSITITTVAAEYSFDDGVTWSTNPVASDLPVGYYLIKIKNEAGCISYPTYVFIEQFTLGFYPDYTVVQPTCGVGGSITITTTPAAEYSFDDGVTWSTNATATNLDPGYYFIMIRNELGCQSYSQYVYVEYYYLPSPTYTVIQATCNTAGSITITSAASEYSFDGGSTWSTNPTISNLSPGTYYVMIRNGAGCQSNYEYVNINYFYLAEPTYVAVDPTCNSLGSITITSVANEYSFDAGVTWTTNPVATNLVSGYYYIMVRENPVCTSNYLYVYLNSTYLPYPDYTLQSPTCDNSGSITVTTVAMEYSFDNGITWTTNPVLNTIQIGTYYYIVIRDAAGCISQANSVYIYPIYLPDPQFSITQPFCTETTGSITINPTDGYEYSFDNGVSYQNSNVSIPLVSGSYYIKVKNANGCESQTMYALIDSATGIPNAPTGNTSQLFCIFNSPTIAFLIANGQNLQWFNSSTSNVPLNNQTPLVDGATYYASQTVAGCESPVRLAVVVTLSNYNIPATDYATLVCDDLNNGQEVINLSDYNSEIVANEIDFVFGYFTTFFGAENDTISEKITAFSNYTLLLGNTTVYVRVESSNGCYKIVTLNLDLIASPEITTLLDNYFLCENSVVSISAGSVYDSYLWSTGETTAIIIVNQAGNYSLTVTENHGDIICTTTKIFSVTLSNIATITAIGTTDWTNNQNTITVELSDSSIGNYAYSMDGIHYQDSNFFEGLSSGVYTVYVKDKNGCGTSKEEVFLLMYSNYFTPNDDGFHDTWAIKFSYYEPGLKVAIFDRYGKFLHELQYNTSWDGKYNGRELPSDDYWFVVTRANGKEHRGHFAMKR